MFVIFSGPLGIFLLLIWVLFEERNERAQPSPRFRKLPDYIPPATNPMHDWESEMIKARKSSTLKARSK